jgi:hypothetical protein
MITPGPAAWTWRPTDSAPDGPLDGCGNNRWRGGGGGGKVRTRERRRRLAAGREGECGEALKRRPSIGPARTCAWEHRGKIGHSETVPIARYQATRRPGARYPGPRVPRVPARPQHGTGSTDGDAQGGILSLVRAPNRWVALGAWRAAAHAGDGQGVDWSRVLTWTQQYGGGRRGAAEKGVVRGRWRLRNARRLRYLLDSRGWRRLRATVRGVSGSFGKMPADRDLNTLV